MVKRALDVTIAVAGLVILSPLMVLVALLIKLDDGGSVFLPNPKRVGKDGELFFMYKFRSMIPNAHEKIRNGELKEYQDQWKKHGKLPIKEDPRITRVGRIIRRTDIDEIPQLINVLLGNMSIVGPRPLPADQIERNRQQEPRIEEYMKDVFSVKPGITGVWQVSGRNSIPTLDQYRMNAQYAKRRSILYDLYIILRTPFAVLTRRGVYE